MSEKQFLLSAGGFWEGRTASAGVANGRVLNSKIH